MIIHYIMYQFIYSSCFIQYAIFKLFRVMRFHINAIETSLINNRDAGNKCGVFDFY